MVIGVLYEGGLDIDPIQELIARVASDSGYVSPITYELYPASAQALPKFLPAATKFSRANVDIFVVHIDTDGDGTRRRTFNDLVDKHQDLLLGIKPVAMVADPHFETYFIKEENALKGFFKLPGTDPLPYSDMWPKARVQNLIKRNLPDEFEFLRDPVIYAQIAKELNLDLLASKDNDFSSFVRDLKAAFDV